MFIEKFFYLCEFSAVLASRERRGTPTKSSISVSSELETYSCSHPRRGRCVIINNHHFNRILTNQSDRDGTEVDALAVENLFVSLSFDVMRYDDLNVNEMSINLREG